MLLDPLTVEAGEDGRWRHAPFPGDADAQRRISICRIEWASGSMLMRHPAVSALRILERSATRLREADLNVFSKLGKQGLEWRLKPEAFAGREVGREDDLLDVLVGCAVDIEVARQPST